MRHVAWEDGQKVERCAEVNAPCSSFFDIFTKLQRLVQTHMSVVARGWVTAALFATFYFFLPAFTLGLVVEEGRGLGTVGWIAAIASTYGLHSGCHFPFYFLYLFFSACCHNLIIFNSVIKTFRSTSFVPILYASVLLTVYV